MNLAAAVTVMQDLANAGYLPTLAKNGPVYSVSAADPAGVPVDAAAIASFATSHGVGAKCSSAVFT